MPSKKCVTIYTRSDYERIAAAIGRSAADIMTYENKFEAAAMWHRLAIRRRRRMPRSDLVKKINSIANKSRRLLKRLETDDSKEASVVADAHCLLTSLGIDDPAGAPDGPGNREVLEALAFEGNLDEDPIIEATRRIGQLADNVDLIEAANDLERRAMIVEAKEAACVLERRAINALRDLEESGDTYENDGEVVKVDVVPKGHSGKVAQNEWIAAMMSLYEKITGRKSGTSIVAPGRLRRGKASGPLIRFLAAAGAPLGIEYSPESWRGRIRDNKTGGRRRK